MPTFETSSSSVRTTRIEVHFDSPVHISWDAVYGCVVIVEQNSCSTHGDYTSVNIFRVGKRLTSKGKEYKNGRFGPLAGTLPWIHLLSAHILREHGFSEVVELELEKYMREVTYHHEIFKGLSSKTMEDYLQRDREVLQLFFPGSTVADQTCLAQV